ncbi:MAG: N-acetyl-gamma-glutamyl-phosphate reductase [Deltaproteobacteria bacterium]|nr:N-acetyl-gamma-glutamyl-phosphate reductase [Deltaproteobacteria bacterium]
MTDRLRIAIVGASGYTGVELARILVAHPRVDWIAAVGRSSVGRKLADDLPSLRGVVDLEVEAFDAASLARRTDAVFCALPHGQSAPIVDELRGHGLTVLDLSADFRLRDREIYEQWYGPHAAPERLAEAVYGLVELSRERLKTADLIAVPGCYPTASILAVAPLLRAELVSPEGLVIDAKSGVSGAGRSPSRAAHLPECAGGVRAYKVGGAHRHIPEIEAALSEISGVALRVTFTPHLVPMTRGILSTVYATAANPALDAEACTEAARALYADSPSVVVLDPGASPDTLAVRGSNRAHLSYAVDGRTGRVIAQAAIDNLVKGAAGQAVQCLNVRFGLSEGLGLPAVAVWP